MKLYQIAKRKLSYLKAYNSSLENMNSIICEENEALESDINKVNDNITIISTQINTKKDTTNKTSNDIKILRKENDARLIQYLKNQNEKLVLEANLPFLR